MKSEARTEQHANGRTCRDRGNAQKMTTTTTTTTIVVLSAGSSVAVGARITCLAPLLSRASIPKCRFVSRKASPRERIGHIRNKAKSLASCCSETMPRASSSLSVTSADYERAKEVWVWTENKQVMTAAVERGWNTFLFSSENQGLANEWSLLALINPLFVEEGDVLDVEKTRVAMVRKVFSPEDVQKLHPESEQAQIVVVDFADWQVIAAEYIVAMFQGSRKTVFAISRNLSEAQSFLEALEHGLGGVVLKVEDVNSVLDLKAYFDRRHEVKSLLSLERAVITGVHTAGMGDRVCVDLCCLMKPGEGLLVGSFARGLFLVHSECMESDYISSRPFRVNAGPVHAYVAIPGGRTCYLSELKAGKEVIVIDQRGRQRTAVVGRVKIESRHLILVVAKIDLDSDVHYTILLQNAETVALVSPHPGDELKSPATIPVTSLKVGHEVVLRTQGGARHTGIEIQEFIVER